MRTDLSDEQVARRGRVGWGAVSQARDGEEGVRVERRDSLGREDEDGISRWLLFGNGAARKSLYGASGLPKNSPMNPPFKPLPHILGLMPGDP